MNDRGKFDCFKWYNRYYVDWFHVPIQTVELFYCPSKDVFTLSPRMYDGPKMLHCKPVRVTYQEFDRHLDTNPPTNILDFYVTTLSTAQRLVRRGHRFKDRKPYRAFLKRLIGALL